MRILFITNYYPPSNYGWGYMQLCEEVADGLAAKGHEIAVLTSTQCDGLEIPRHYPVHRWLRIEPDWHSGRSAAWQFFVGRRRREREAVAQFRHLVAKLRPDVVFIWHAIGLPRVLLQAAESLKDTVSVYYLAGYLPELPDEYIAYWQRPPVHPLARLLKRPFSALALAMLQKEGKPVSLAYSYTICVSNYVRERLISQGLIPEGAVVIHNGIDLHSFSSKRPPRLYDHSIKLLYAGRLEPDKGVHHILEALGEVNHHVENSKVSLAIVGDGDPEYICRCQVLAKNLGISNRISLHLPVTRDRMPVLLDDYDVLILPSVLEALSRMMQEAMAMGLLVIGTTTGGSGELLVHEQTGLVFEAGNADALAEQVLRAIREPALARRLAQAGQQAVRERFTIQHTVEQIERYLLNLAQGKQGR